MDTASAAGRSADIRLAALVDALHDEARWVDRLSAILRDHRASLVQADSEGAEAAVFAVRRVVATLLEARRRRDLLLTAATGHDAVELEELGGVLGEPLPVDLVEARASLANAAGALRGEVCHNRRILLDLRAELDTYLDREPSGVHVEDGA